MDIEDAKQTLNENFYYFLSTDAENFPTKIKL